MPSEKKIVGLSLGYDGDLFSSWCSGDNDDTLFSPGDTASFLSSVSATTTLHLLLFLDFKFLGLLYMGIEVISQKGGY